MLLALSITVGVLIFATLILLALFQNVEPSMIGPTSYRPCKWYEARVNGAKDGLKAVPQQPVNTFTNLAYLAAGLWVALAVSTPPSYVFAVTMIYLFIGSTLYHAVSTHWAGMLDVTAMYSIFSALTAYGLCELIGVPIWLTTGLMLVVGGVTAYLLSNPFRQKVNFGVGIFLAATYILLLLHMWRSGNWGAWLYLGGSLVTYALAFFIWKLDRTETSPFKRWGHGLWHILCATASALVFIGFHVTT